jgi:hypothetical protein
MVETGQSYLVANGVKHAVRNAVEKTADIVLAGDQQPVHLFPRRGGPLRDASRRFIQRLIRVSQAYGYWDASPLKAPRSKGEMPLPWAAPCARKRQAGSPTQNT